MATNKGGMLPEVTEAEAAGELARFFPAQLEAQGPRDGGRDLAFERRLHEPIDRGQQAKLRIDRPCPLIYGHA